VSDQLILLLVGFGLTTVVGGLLGYLFQRRAWSNQNRATLREAERQAAVRTFEELSNAMDRRLHRMTQLEAFLRREDSDASQLVEKHLELYREALDIWNENLNRNLALTQRYFGGRVKSYLETEIYERFQRAGGELETGYRQRARTEQAFASASLQQELRTLNERIYDINVEMIGLVQQGNVGLFNSDTDTPRIA
jgi:hypothetical protein